MKMMPHIQGWWYNTVQGVFSSAATVALSLRQVWHSRFDYFGLLILATGTPSQVIGFSGNAEEIR